MNLSEHKHIPLFFVLFALVLILFGPFPTKALAGVYEVNNIPWSGYWWPITAGGLGTGRDYRGHPAPLEKYELLENGSYPGPGTSWYLDRYYDPQAPFWWGQCADWAWASSYEHIAFFPSSEDNIIFRVGDKKGLMTLAHNNDIAIREDGTRPEVFHYWLLYYIKDEKEAFVADLDPGEQVWSYPVFKYDMAETRSGNTQSVTVTIFYADDNVLPDYMGTQVRTETYTYDLTLDGEGEITVGTWMGDSIDRHPDGLSYPLFQRSSSPYLDYVEVSRLAHSRDDFLENGPNEVEISPGTYHLVLMDEDRYRIACSFRDTVLLDLEQQPGSAQDIVAVLTDADGFTEEAMIVSEASSMHLVLMAQNPPYFLSLTQEDYSDPNIYTMSLGLKRSFMQQIPYLSKSGMWSGFALTNPDDVSQEGIVLVTYDAEGYPIQTVLGPVDLQAGEKRVFFFSHLPWRRHEYATSERLVLFSQRPVRLLNLLGLVSSKMAAFVQGGNKGSHLVIPDVKSFMSTDRSMTGAVINESVRETEIRMRVYAEDGDFKREVNVPLGRGEKLPIMPGSSPFYSMPSEGWIDIEAEGDRQISGYQSLISAQAFETMFALPVRAGRRIIPNVPPPGRWITRVTLVNPNDAENRIVFHPTLAGGDSAEDLAIILGPYEKTEFEIQEWFGWQSGDPLFQSLVEVEGERPFVGYYSYGASSGLGDEVSLPLLDESDFDRELILPHFPGTALGYWWTGIGLFNPTLYEAVIGVKAYDDQGERVETTISTLRLDPGAYEVMLVRSIGGERASEISFVKFVARDLGSVIGGFYLYGHNAKDGTMLSLSGANM